MAAHGPIATVTPQQLQADNIAKLEQLNKQDPGHKYHFKKGDYTQVYEGDDDRKRVGQFTHDSGSLVRDNPTPQNAPGTTPAQPPGSTGQTPPSGQPGTPATDLNDLKGAIQKGGNNRADTVKHIQEMLKKAGYKIATDGKFGPETQAALGNYVEKTDPQLAKDIRGINTGPDRQNARTDFMDTNTKLMGVCKGHQLQAPAASSQAGHHSRHVAPSAHAPS